MRKKFAAPRGKEPQRKRERKKKKFLVSFGLGRESPPESPWTD